MLTKMLLRLVVNEVGTMVLKQTASNIIVASSLGTNHKPILLP